MQTRILYKYRRANGGIDISPVMPQQGTEYETLYRLIADDGKILVNGSGVECECIDTESPEDWEEVGLNNSDKAEAYDILTGGAV